MVIIGLTGSIGMGKTTAGKLLKQIGVPVCDSDVLVHRFMKEGGPAVPQIAKAFPGVVQGNKVDRDVLGKIVFQDTGALRRLEGIIHPLVWAGQKKFLKSVSCSGHRMAVLDVPLLYENSSEQKCDFVIVITAPEFLQRQRVMKRKGMTEARFRGTLDHQMRDIEKQKRADFVVQSGLGRRHTLKALKTILKIVGSTREKKWKPGWQ